MANREQVIIDTNTKGRIVYAEITLGFKTEWILLISHVEPTSNGSMMINRYVSYCININEPHISVIPSKWGETSRFNFFEPTELEIDMIKDIIKRNGLKYVKSLNKLIKR